MKPDEEFTEEETVRRRDAVLKVMVNTPPQPRTSTRPTRKSRKPTGADRAHKPSDRPGKP